MNPAASASGFQRKRGARALLFERLVGRQAPLAVAGEQPDQGPPRLHDTAGLRASVARELADLFNTRAPLPPAARLPLPPAARLPLTRGTATLTTIDYGFPDLSAFSFGEHSAMDRLTRHVRDAILRYEPRLHNPVVRLERGAGTAGAVTVIVSGSLEQEGVHDTPVVFRLACETGVADPDAI